MDLFETVFRIFISAILISESAVNLVHLIIQTEVLPWFSTLITPTTFFFSFENPAVFFIKLGEVQNFRFVYPYIVCLVHEKNCRIFSIKTNYSMVFLVSKNL